MTYWLKREAINDLLRPVHTPVKDRPARVLLCPLACGTSLPPFRTHTAALPPLNASAFPASSSRAGSVCARVLSRVRLLVTPRAVARRAPLSTWILQARTLEWVATSFSRGSSDPGVEPESPASLASGRQVLQQLRHWGSPDAGSNRFQTIPWTSFSFTTV